MTRETAAAKSVRYLGEGRLTITLVSGDSVRAVCRGSGAVHQCGHDLGRGWWCSCPARTDQCCHVRALMLVTIARNVTQSDVQPGREHHGHYVT